jgi:hypothetical protein
MIIMNYLLVSSLCTDGSNQDDRDTFGLRVVGEWTSNSGFMLKFVRSLR